MKRTALTRLVAHARKEKAFVKLLREDRKAALKEAAQSGIRLSPKETKLLEKVLAGDRLVLSLDQLDMVSSLEAATRIKGNRPFWPIRFSLLIHWHSGKRLTFSKSRGPASKRRKR